MIIMSDGEYLKKKLDRNLSQSSKYADEAMNTQSDLVNLEEKATEAIEILNYMEEKEIIYEMLDEEYYKYKKRLQEIHHNLIDSENELKDSIKEAIILELVSAKEIVKILEQGKYLEYINSQLFIEFKIFIDNIPLNRNHIKSNYNDRLNALKDIVYNCRYAGLNSTQCIKYMASNWNKLKEIYHFDQLIW